MAENERSELSMVDRAMALGWHVLQGEELAAAYVKAAEEAGEPQWAEFFRYVEGEYRSLSDEGGAKLPDMGTKRRRRPPW
jgi:hypothetical protein